MLVSLLAVLNHASGLAQTAEPYGDPPFPPGEARDAPPLAMSEQSGIPPPRSAGEFAQTPLLPPASPAARETPADLVDPGNDGSVPLERPEESPPASLRDFVGYRYWTSSLDWIPGGGDKFGMFSLAWDHYQQSGMHSGLGVGMGFHFLGGPVQTDMPPRVFDFSLAYQIRNQWGPLRFDVAASVLAASDFEGSARKGILFPGHAVGYLNLQPEFDLVFGVDYLSRGDIKLLPVGGCVWTPTPEFRFEVVFPRPRAVFQVAERHRLYVAGELGGGSWAIERVTGANDLATYRDLGVYLGLEHLDKDAGRWAFEVGYLFDRRLEYASGIGNTPLGDAMMLRWVTRY